MKPPPANTLTAPITGPLRAVAIIALLGLLLVLALRLTISETLRQTLSQKAAWLAAIATGKTEEFPRFVGPAAITTFAALTMLFAAAAAACAALARTLTAGRLARFLLLAAIVTLAVISASFASNRFPAIIGAADLAAGLLAAWTISILCTLLGDSARRIVIATLIAVLATWTFRGLYQRFIESPDAIAQYYKDKPAQLRQVGINPDDAYAVKLFESRMLGMEVNGFISLSNVMAEGLIGLTALLAGLLAARFIPPARTLPASPPPQDRSMNRRSKPPPRPAESREISIPNLLLGLGIVLLAAALFTTILTRSRGGSVLAIVATVIIALGAWQYRTLIARRKALLVAAAAIFVCIVIAVLCYGLAKHSLPSKSLTFRWQYWTGAERIIEHSPLHGVGLCNFGEHYITVKRPSSPEDVTDPHSFFIRAAAEIGIPAAILLAALILWQILAATRPSALPPPALRTLATGWPVFIAALALALLWWTLHFFLADNFFAYNVYFLFIFAILAAAAAWMALELMAELSPAGLRALSLAALLGAVGMLLYDQINMGLLTGSISMLFWCLLGLADSYDSPTARPAPRPAAWLLAAILAAAAIITLAFLTLPILQNRMPWDPAPFETQAIQSINTGNYPAALANIDQALIRDPRSIELRNQQIALKQKLHLPIAADIQKVLHLDTANAAPRITLAQLDSDVPPAQRAAILEQALHLDDQLPKDEPKRLSPAEVTRIKNLINQLHERSGQ